MSGPSLAAVVLHYASLLAVPAALAVVASGCVIRERYYYLDGEESDEEGADDSQSTAGSTNKPSAKAADAGADGRAPATSNGTNNASTGGTTAGTQPSALTCTARGSCSRGTSCEEFASGDAAAANYTKVCTDSGGGYATGACVRTGSVGGCEIDGSSATICAKTTVWYFPPSTADAVKQVCVGPKAKLLTP